MGLRGGGGGEEGGCFAGCLTSQHHRGVSQGRVCTDNFTFCHTEIEAADQTFYLTQSQYTDTEYHEAVVEVAVVVVVVVAVVVQTRADYPAVLTAR